MIVLLLPLLLGVALFGAAVVAGRWVANTNPQQLAATLRSSGGVAMIAIGALLLMRGRGLIGMSLITAGLGRLGLTAQGGGGFAGGPFAGGPFGPGPFGPGRSKKRPGQSSTVRTARLEASLDHDSGEMSVTMRTGRFAGRRLSDLSEKDVIAVWRECADDEQSRLVVEAYLDRRRPEWREDVEGHAHGGAGGSGGARGAHSSGAMTEQDAYEVLGLKPGAGETEIRAAHRRLMKEMHPDRGGSAYLATQLNLAKDVLLRRR
ncbi:J domain-containing protein [Acuticoccus kandeliae]|uniref:J domain-containing protein n=1 Tax=Acuticoccus kandeliae TaxID=2073160 RepID=UPI00196BAD8B|nr:DnaJ domain-containing protein [Acuticoccus kandeliae]